MNMHMINIHKLHNLALSATVGKEKAKMSFQSWYKYGTDTWSRASFQHLHSTSWHHLTAALPTKGIRSPGLLCWGPMTWNTLPHYLRNPSRSVGDFQRMLKTVQFTRFSVFDVIKMLHESALYKFTIDTENDITHSGCRVTQTEST